MCRIEPSEANKSKTLTVPHASPGLHNPPSVATTPALDVTIVRIVGLCLLRSPIARTIIAFHISLSVPVLHTMEVTLHIRALPVLRQFSAFFFNAHSCDSRRFCELRTNCARRPGRGPGGRPASEQITPFARQKRKPYCESDRESARHTKGPTLGSPRIPKRNTGITVSSSSSSATLMMSSARPTAAPSAPCRCRTIALNR